MSTINRQMPGIEFQAVLPQVEEALPRMDIAAFVGFAESGPIDTPVAVEDMAGFREIFGADVALARDPGTGQMLYSQLGPAVEAFFKNGGKRCWVVRVGIDTDSSPDAGERKKFQSGLFLDPDLAEVDFAALLGEANHKLYINNQPLHGIHSLLPIEEVTLVSVPDAVQPGWKSQSQLPPQTLTAPVLSLEQGTATLMLEWSGVQDNPVYTLQESEDSLFQGAITLYRGKSTHFTVVPRRPCPGSYFYRVNAQADGRLSPWSNTVGEILPAADFADCRMMELNEPLLSLVITGSPPGSEFILAWSPVAAAQGYVLEEAGSPDFAGAEIIYEGNETSFNINYRDPGDNYFYRVRTAGTVWPCWSNTCIYESPGDDIWLALAPGDYREPQRNELLKIHQGLLRFCAARGDMFAVLDLPRHYKKKDAVDYKNELVPNCEGKTNCEIKNEERVFSFGALYHPWTCMSIESGFKAGGGGLRYVPPGGAVCGVMAARTIGRGAWIAPANEPLKGVMALEPFIQTREWQELFDIQINVIRQTPRGFILLSADTLSREIELQPVNVRRLLILLRRLAMREGMTYVFQPNNRDFHRRVQYRFEQFLARMYTRGAFAGDRPETSYQVVVDSSVNTAASLDQGRFIIELRVAPSLPMTFITVRLVQSQNEGLSIMEI